MGLLGLWDILKCKLTLVGVLLKQIKDKKNMGKHKVSFKEVPKSQKSHRL